MVAIAGLLPGCSWMSAAGQSKKVIAEYRGLDNKTAAIVIYTAEANMDEFPGAREDISAFIDKQMKLHLPTTRLVNYKEVINWQEDTLNWFAMPEKEIGKHFSVDRVIYIEVLAYESRAEQAYGDLQGHVRANCKVFEVDTPGIAPAWTGVIDVKWPKDRPADGTQTTEMAVRSRTLALFAQDLIGHFYDHKEEETPMEDR
jgi:hypothetical protein